MVASGLYPGVVTHTRLKPRRHALGYRRVRNALVLATATGLLGFVLLPVAPPRMLPGYVDVLASTSGRGWWGSATTATRSGVRDPVAASSRLSRIGRRLCDHRLSAPPSQPNQRCERRFIMVGVLRSTSLMPTPRRRLSV